MSCIVLVQVLLEKGRLYELLILYETTVLKGGSQYTLGVTCNFGVFPISSMFDGRGVGGVGASIRARSGASTLWAP